MTTTRIGWIGLGEMGLKMALNAQRKGFHVVGHTRGRPQHAELAQAGGELVGDPRAVASGAAVVCINVFTDDQVRAVLFDDGVLAAMEPGAVLVIHTTGDPALSQEAARLAPQGVEVVDGAFSGLPWQAASGELAIMAGGSARAYAIVQPLLETYGLLVRHVGPLGAGMRLKLVNNLLLAAHVRLASEAYALARREGFDAQVVAEVLNRCSSSSRALAILGDGGRVEENLAHLRYYLDKDLEVVRRIAARSGLDLGVLGDLVEDYRLGEA